MCKNKIKQIWIIRDSLQAEESLFIFYFWLCRALVAACDVFVASQGLLSGCDMGSGACGPSGCSTRVPECMGSLV